MVNDQGEMKRFALVKLDGRLALCELHGDVFLAESWKEARKMIPDEPAQLSDSSPE